MQFVVISGWIHPKTETETTKALNQESTFFRDISLFYLELGFNEDLTIPDHSGFSLFPCFWSKKEITLPAFLSLNVLGFRIKQCLNHVK